MNGESYLLPRFWKFFSSCQNEIWTYKGWNKKDICSFRLPRHVCSEQNKLCAPQSNGLAAQMIADSCSSHWTGPDTVACLFLLFPMLPVRPHSHPTSSYVTAPSLCPDCHLLALPLQHTGNQSCSKVAGCSFDTFKDVSNT